MPHPGAATLGVQEDEPREVHVLISPDEEQLGEGRGLSFPTPVTYGLVAPASPQPPGELDPEEGLWSADEDGLAEGREGNDVDPDSDEDIPELIPLCRSANTHASDDEGGVGLGRLKALMEHCSSIVLAPAQDEDPLARRISEAYSVRSFKELEPLLDLELPREGLSALPECISTLKHLERLDLQGNHLQELPSGICELVSLSDLVLADNALERLPESIGSLGSLKVLRLERNKLTSLPASIGKLSSLRWLEAQGNRLQALPDSICQLGALQMLKVEDNQLTSLPEDFGCLASLRWFHCSRNQLRTLPDSFPKLAALENLHAEENCLTVLPAHMEKLGGLQVLDLEANALSELPAALVEILQLRTLRVSGNSLAGGLLPHCQKLSELEDLDLGPLNTLRGIWASFFGAVDSSRTGE